MKRLALALCLFAGSADGQTISGNNLMSLCTNLEDRDSVQAGYCVGYITGVWEGIKLGAFQVILLSGATGSAAEIDAVVNDVLGICLPEGVQSAQVVDVMIKSLKENPASRHLPARSLLRDAMMEAFPCS